MSIIGIDLGTTKSVAAVWRDGEPVIIPDPNGPQGNNRVMPSVVALDPDTGAWVVGHPALEIARREPDNAIFSAKRLMGRRYDEEVVQEQIQRRHLYYQLGESRRASHAIAAVIEGRQLTPQEVAAMILGQLKKNAEAFLGERVERAVITVPAYFNLSQRQATKDAGRIQGLDVKQVLNEPTAACLAFGFGQRNEPRQNVAIYDLGGGTFDISIMEVGGSLPFSVRSTSGDMFLGGDDLNWIIVEWVLQQLSAKDSQLVRAHLPSLAALRAEAERVKVVLSDAPRAELYIDVAELPAGMEPLRKELDVNTLNELARPWIERTLIPCRTALHDAKLNLSEIGEVLMVGGQTQMPAICAAARDFFGVEPTTDVPAQEIVGQGAAVQAAIIDRKIIGVKLYDIVPLSLGLNSEGRMDVLIMRGSRLPARASRTYTTTQDRQDRVTVTVYQGENELVKDNTRLDTFDLPIAPAPVGEPEVDVLLYVDFDGILNVSAQDRATGYEQSVVITDSISLSSNELAVLRAEVSADQATGGEPDSQASPASERGSNGGD